MKSEIVIKLETKFNKFMDSDHDERYKKGGIFHEDHEEELTEDLELSFHNALYKLIENHLIEYDDKFEEDMLELVSNDGWDLSIKPIKEIGDFGEIEMRVQHTEPKQNK